MLIWGFLGVLATARFWVRVLNMLTVTPVWLHPKKPPWLCRGVSGM